MGGYIGLRVVIGGYGWLWVHGYRGLYRVMGGYRGLWVVIEGYRWL